MAVTPLIEELVVRTNKVRMILGLPLRDAHDLSWTDVGALLEQVETNIAYARFSYGDTSPEVGSLERVKEDLRMLQQEIG